MHTSDLPGAGTGGGSWVDLEGLAGSSGPQDLPSGPLAFERGQVCAHTNNLQGKVGHTATQAHVSPSSSHHATTVQMQNLQHPTHTLLGCGWSCLADLPLTSAARVHHQGCSPVLTRGVFAADSSHAWDGLRNDQARNELETLNTNISQISSKPHNCSSRALGHERLRCRKSGQ